MKNTIYTCLLLALLPVLPALGQSTAPVSAPTPPLHAASSGYPVMARPGMPPFGLQQAAPIDLAITGDNGGNAIDIPSFHAGEVKLSLKNISDHEITATHFSFNSTAVFVPIAPIILAPGATGSFSLYVDGRQLPTPASIYLSFRIHDAKGENVRSARLSLTSKDAIIWEPKYVFWRSGEPATPKTIHITQGPAGLKIISAKSSSPDFTVTLEAGNSIAITPIDITKAHGGAIMIMTDPASPRPIFIPVNVLPAQPKPSISPAPLKSANTQPTLPNSVSNPANASQKTGTTSIPGN
ncbi:MAG TPA: hypothetical protein VK717_01525 [Opitutaceae bacterium]|jgi:hypothetical protein|nr:hypothetical protein [Opitutaceae bacterium]